MASQSTTWHDEHVRFSRLLDLLEEQIDEFHEGGYPDFDRMREIIRYLHEYGDSTHHPREDAAYARLLAADPTLRLPVNRLLQEHRAITAAGEELLLLLDDVTAGAVVRREMVEAAAALYLAYYRHHLATEENQFLPRTVHLLKPEDWRAVAEAVPMGADPLFGDPPSEAYRELRALLEEKASTQVAQ
jgi:hemerythrin-like domain-containing protein